MILLCSTVYSTYNQRFQGIQSVINNNHQLKAHTSHWDEDTRQGHKRIALKQGNENQTWNHEIPIKCGTCENYGYVIWLFIVRVISHTVYSHFLLTIPLQDPASD